MPIYCYECSRCTHNFEELRSLKENSGNSSCPKCGNVSFKIPAVFTPKIFKKRVFADGSMTPEHVTTHSQEKNWMKSEGITFDTSKYVNNKLDREKEKKKKSKTVMEAAFKDAVGKCEQGFKIEGLDKQPQKEAKSAMFKA